MKTITKLLIVLAVLSFVPVAASADEWFDTSKGSQQRWNY
jgi:hypothetical protein